MVAIIVVAVVVSVTILIASMLFLKKLRLKLTINVPPAISAIPAGNQPDIELQAAALSVGPILAIKPFRLWLVTSSNRRKGTQKLNTMMMKRSRAINRFMRI